MTLRGLLLTSASLVLFLGTGTPALAQDQDTSSTRPDTPSAIPDSVTQQGPSNTRTPQSGQPSQQRPSGPSQEGSGQNANAVTFSSEDSLVIRTDSSGGKHGTLYGNSKMSHQGATVEADTIEMNFQSSTLRAKGAPSDTAQGGRPVFTPGDAFGGSSSQSTNTPGGSGQGGDKSFTGDVLSYNLSTQRGRVVDARTERSNGYVQGGAVKMYEDNTLFVQEGTYTTCNCPPGVTPSYSLRSDQMKLKEKWVYTGPIQLYLFNVPTPLWLPFGFLPNIEGRRSGPLPPEYGEDNKGFYLQNWGWYFALNDYTDLTLRASIWSQGSYEFRPRFRYEKRYEYNGNFRFTYRRVRIGEDEDPNPVRRHEGQLKWQHDQTLSPTASINGDINLATSSDFARRNSEDYDDAVRQDVSSSVNYRKRWPNGNRSFSISASQQQQLRTGEVRMTLPNVSFSQQDISPFKQEERIGSRRWYERIRTSYSLDAQNTYNFTPRDLQELRERGDSTLADSLEQSNVANIDWYDALVDRNQYQLATGDDELYDFQATHRVPLNVSFRVNRYNLSLSPNLSYNSTWHLNTVRRVAQRDSTGGVGEITERTVPGFYARHDFNSSFSASTELYGLFPINVGPFEGLRHRLRPSLSVNYQPNFNARVWGRTRRVQFEDGTPVPEDSLDRGPRYDIVGGSFVRGSNEQRSLSFSLNNVFESKRVTTDTTGEQESEKVQLLNLDASGFSYNFAADSFKVGNSINVTARTRIDPFNINLRSNFSPYALRPTTTGGETTFRRVDRLMVQDSPLTPARLTSFDLSLSASFSSDDGGRSSVGGQRTTRRRRRQGSVGRQRQNASRRRGHPQQRGQSTSGQQRRSTSSSSNLSELRVPWSLNLTFNYGISKPQKEISDRSATLQLRFQLNLTSNWNLQGDTGYDFMQNKLSTTRIRLNRSLGCWNMSFNWVPFGEYQKYGFNLQVSSGQLSQLLQLQIPNQGGEGRLGGFGDRLQGTVQGAAGLGGGGGGGLGRSRF